MLSSSSSSAMVVSSHVWGTGRGAEEREASTTGGEKGSVVRLALQATNNLPESQQPISM